MQPGLPLPLTPEQRECYGEGVRTLALLERLSRPTPDTLFECGQPLSRRLLPVLCEFVAPSFLVISIRGLGRREPRRSLDKPRSGWFIDRLGPVMDCKRGELQLDRLSASEGKLNLRTPRAFRRFDQGAPTFAAARLRLELANNDHYRGLQPTRAREHSAYRTLNRDSHRPRARISGAIDVFSSSRRLWELRTTPAYVCCPGEEQPSNVRCGNAGD
jgi:hypothetical protein